MQGGCARGHARGLCKGPCKGAEQGNCVRTVCMYWGLLEVACERVQGRMQRRAKMRVCVHLKY